MTRRPTPDSDSRDDRLKAALRANLARRKAQARARADNDEQPASGIEHPPEPAASED